MNLFDAMGAPGMGKGHLPPPGNVVVFCALVTNKSRRKSQ